MFAHPDHAFQAYREWSHVVQDPDSRTAMEPLEITQHGNEEALIWRPNLHKSSGDKNSFIATRAQTDDDMLMKPLRAMGVIARSLSSSEYLRVWRIQSCCQFASEVICRHCANLPLCRHNPEIAFHMQIFPRNNVQGCADIDVHELKYVRESPLTRSEP